LVSFALRRSGFALGTAVFLAACASPKADEPPCSAGTEEPLINAATEESYLGLAAAELRAIVPIVDGAEPGGPLCTGAFVATDWVVTAAHCLQIDPAEVIVSTEQTPALFVPVLESVPHPLLDVALMRVDLSDAEIAADEIAPLGVARPTTFEVATGVVVELAGFGLTEAGDTRELRFLAEPIVTVEDESVVVDGFGANGACVGDSGGPLLARGPDGAPLIVGVLTAGAATCVDRDRYVRLDTLGDWIEQTTGSLVPADNACGGIAPEGRCLYGSALFCEGTTLVAQACAGETSCGWDESQAGFRCVRATDDPCRGVDSVGACRNDVALSCNAGVLEKNTCTCGHTCRIDGKTGGPHCTE